MKPSTSQRTACLLYVGLLVIAIVEVLILAL
jgi:hypothetical protein